MATWEEIFTSNSPTGTGRVINVVAGSAVAGTDASPYTSDSPSGTGRCINVNILSGGGSTPTGMLQIAGGVALDSTLRYVTDNSTVPVSSTLKLSTLSAEVTTKLGIATGGIAPLAPLHVGNNNVNRSSDCMVLVSRLVNDTGGMSGQNGHVFSDSSNISRSGTIGYCSYDARYTVTGTASYDHFADFQSSGYFNNAGTIGAVYGLFSGGNVIAGTTITSRYGMWVSDFSGGGTVTNNYGIRVSQLSYGTNNYGIYMDNNNMYMNGQLQIGVNVPAYLSAPVDGTMRITAAYTSATATTNMINFVGTATAGTNADTLYGVLINPTLASNSKTGLFGSALRIAGITSGTGYNTLGNSPMVDIDTTSWTGAEAVIGNAYALRIKGSAPTMIFQGNGAANTGFALSYDGSARMFFQVGVSGNPFVVGVNGISVNGGSTPTAWCDLNGSTTARATIRMRSGTAPTSPNDGDMWYDGTGVKFRVGGTTKTFTLI